MSGDKARGTPLRHRPHIFAASSSGSILSLFDCKKSSKPDDVGLDLLEDRKAAVQAELSRLGYHVVLSVFPQDEEPWLAGLLVIGVILFRAAANGGRS